MVKGSGSRAWSSSSGVQDSVRTHLGFDATLQTSCKYDHERDVGGPKIMATLSSHRGPAFWKHLYGYTLNWGSPDICPKSHVMNRRIKLLTQSCMTIQHMDSELSTRWHNGTPALWKSCRGCLRENLLLGIALG